MEDQLINAGQQPLPPLQQLPQFIHICQHALNELRNYLNEHPFTDNQQEIQFFKDTQPRFYSQFIYYINIFQVEIQRPTASDAMLAKYFEAQLDRLHHFFDSNADFYHYYRSGATHFDTSYFVRGQQPDLRLVPDDLSLIIDPVFCTLQSYKVSRLLANEQMRDWLNKAISNLMEITRPKATPNEKKLQWTGSKVSLIELIYALQASGVFNHASADIKQLTEFFEFIFQVKLGNVYNTFNEMRIRKKNRSNFLDQLKERLLQRMDEADDR